MPDNPYPPAVTERVLRLEDRQERIETTVAGIVTTTAVHTEQIAGFKDDMKEIAATFKEAGEHTNARIDKLLRAAWMLVLTLIPVAASLVTIALTNR